MPGENFASSPYGRADDVAQVEEIEAQLDRAGFEAGHVEQIADEAVEALGFVLQRREHFIALARRVLVSEAA